MDANDLTATATVAGVVVATLFGAGGLAVGIIGLVQARKARSAAANSNTIANEANALAKEANELAQAANGVIREQADRTTERTDVAWDWRWDMGNTDYVVIQNIGKSLAKDVIAQFFFEETVEANDRPIDIEGRQEIKFVIPALAERRQFAAEAERSGIEWALAQRTTIPPGKTARVRLRVTWLTPRGTPGSYDTLEYDAPL